MTSLSKWTRKANQLSDSIFLPRSFQWTWEENDAKIRLVTKSLQTVISKISGSIRFLRSDGSLLLAERDYEKNAGRI